MTRARLILMNAALGPLDYRVPHGMAVEPGQIVVAPLGPRPMVGVVWDEGSFAEVETVGDNRLRPLLGTLDAPPIPAPLRRLVEWTADYYLAPLAAVLRMALASTSALEGEKLVIEYRRSGAVPERLTAQREQALERIGDRHGRREHGRAHGGARVQRDVLGDVERLETALLRVPGHRDHLVRVGTVVGRVVNKPELHVGNLSRTTR